jgi:hypothetical protein
MTDTPETNAAEFPCMRWLSRDHPMGVRSEFAKRLERERDEARFDLDFRRELFKLQSNTLKSVTEQRDRLAEALDKVLDAWDHAEWLDENDFESFRAALQSLTSPNE